MSFIDRYRTSKETPTSKSEPPGMDALRQLAGDEARVVEAGVTGHRAHIVEVYRNPAGQVTHSVERFEEVVSPYIHTLTQKYE